MYEELVRKLRNRRICVQSGGDLEKDFPLLQEAANAIEKLNRLRVAAEENRMHWQDMAVKFECDLHDAEGKIPKWVSVNERLPEKNTWVLAYCKYKGHVVDYMDINGLWSYGNVTHWMPLPEPPKEKTE